MEDLYISELILSRVIVDGGAMFNVMFINILKKLGKIVEDLTTTNMKMINFTGGGTHALGVLVAYIIVGTKIKKAMFFMVDAKPTYTLLLRRNWIHGSKCPINSSSVIDVFEWRLDRNGASL